MTDLPGLLHRYWAISPSDVRPLGGGMNSETWAVEAAGTSYVAKRVSRADLDDFVMGCELAATLAGRGIVTGRPVATTDGRLVVSEHALALLERVSGRELEGETDEEQRWIAATMADVHRAGEPAPGPSSAAFATDWLTPDAAGVAAHPWLVRAIVAVRAESDPLPVTWSVVHADPAPEAFVHDDVSGVTGLIDWSGSKRGPVLYDVASAVMYLGGPDSASTFLETYAALGPLGQDELRSLDAFRRFRWAVQGAYFAWRLSVRDLTGIDDDSGNHKGLRDAREGLAELGFDTA